MYSIHYDHSHYITSFHYPISTTALPHFRIPALTKQVFDVLPAQALHKRCVIGDQVPGQHALFLL